MRLGCSRGRGRRHGLPPVEALRREEPALLQATCRGIEAHGLGEAREGLQRQVRTVRLALPEVAQIVPRQRYAALTGRLVGLRRLRHRSPFTSSRTTPRLYQMEPISPSLLFACRAPSAPARGSAAFLRPSQIVKNPSKVECRQPSPFLRRERSHRRSEVVGCLLELPILLQLRATRQIGVGRHDRGGGGGEKPVGADGEKPYEELSRDDTDGPPVRT